MHFREVCDCMCFDDQLGLQGSVEQKLTILSKKGMCWKHSRSLQIDGKIRD